MALTIAHIAGQKRPNQSRKTLSEMDSLRPIEAAENAVEGAKNKARGKLLDWLPHHQCACGEICKAETQFVERQVDYLPVWQCPNEDCGKRYYRDDDVDKHTADIWDR